jgi:hypothetical protein
MSTAMISAVVSAISIVSMIEASIMLSIALGPSMYPHTSVPVSMWSYPESESRIIVIHSSARTIIVISIAHIAAISLIIAIFYASIPPMIRTRHNWFRIVHNTTA